jgi:hypothetical protein
MPREQADAQRFFEFADALANSRLGDEVAFAAAVTLPSFTASQKYLM